MEVSFIMIEPAVPENIGAAARAIKTMGFNDLRLVNPKNYPHEKADWLAHGSRDILEKSMVYPNLEKAIVDIDFIIGTSAKKRRIKFDYYRLQDLPEFLLQKKDSVQKIAVLFGREESGLSNSELQVCDIITYIPLAQAFPSLNLAQAVMLYAYTLSTSESLPDPLTSDKIPPPYRIIKEQTKEFLEKIGITSTDAKQGRILERVSKMGDADLKLLQSILNKIENSG